jgi:hypothetical protein
MRPLGDGYQIEVDAMAPEQWYATVASFADANLYQLWYHGSGRQRLTSVSRAMIKRDGAPVAVAELRLFGLPRLRCGMAYVLWGPVFRRGSHEDRETFRQAVRALRDEYVGRRGLVLRITPRLLAEQHGDLLQVLIEEGFAPTPDRKARQSLVVDLTASPDELRRDLDKKWRNCLSKAEKSGLAIETGTSDELLAEFQTVYERMLTRKQFNPSADFDKHRRIQAVLPDDLKLQVVVARQGGAVCAGTLYSALGDTAVYLFGATDDAGMRCSASYLVQWHILLALKERGVRYYDLNGVDPVGNPGTYHFKRGLAGKKSVGVTFAPPYEAAPSSLRSAAVLLIEQLQRRARRTSANAEVVKPPADRDEAAHDAAIRPTAPSAS